MAIKIEGFDTAGGGGAGAIRYAGTYNATTNTPDLTSSLLGDLYYIEVGGTLAGVSLSAGDHILFNQNASSPITASMFDKVDSTDAVDSVNGQVGAVVLDTDDISETATNQYFTSARFDTQLGTKTTDNLTEGSTNQYFTNTRADARISAADLTDLSDVDYTAGAGIDGRVLTYVNANSRWEAVASPSAPVTSVNTQTGAVVLDSDDVSEGSTNQYFTNTRADARISAADLTDLSDVDYTAGAGIDGRVLTYVNANSRWEAVASPSAPVTSVNTQTGAVVLDSDDVSEGSTNQYFTSPRFTSELATKTTDNLTEGSTNQYFTNTRADARISAADLTDLSDVDYTAGAGIDGRVLTYVNANSRWEAVASPSAPVTSVNTQTGAVVLDSDDVSEGSTNQYFTNTRADARISAADLTDLSDVDYTAGAGIDGRVLTYVNANNRWEAVAPSGGSIGTLQQVTDQGSTTTTNISTAQITLGGDLLADGVLTRTIGDETNRFITSYSDLNGAIRFKAKASEALSKGDVVYIDGVSGGVPTVSKARANSSSTMPAFGLCYAAASLNAEVQIVTLGNIEGLNTGSFSVGDTLYVSDSTAGALTNTAPTSETNLIQNIAKVVKVDAVGNSGIYKVGGAGRTAATPNLNQDKIFLGNASNQAVSTALSSINLSSFNNNLDTDDIPEATNQYFTNTRADARISAADLTDLSDVDYTAGAGIDGRVLTYVNANSRWEAVAPSGGGGFTYSAITSASSPVTGVIEYHYSADTSGGAITIDLPAIAVGNAGKEIRVKLKTAGNNLVLSPDGTDQVEAGGAGVDYTLTVQNSAITLVSDGSSNWEII